MQDVKENFVRFFERAVLSRLTSRILFAAAVSYIGMIILAFIRVVTNVEEVCGFQVPLEICLIKTSVSLISLDNVQNFGLLLAAILYILEGRDRKQRSHNEAWQIIDAAHGVETSYARINALQTLNKDGISLRRIDLPNVDLQGIDLYQADLQDANLENADLRGANLKEANLKGANLKGARLTQGLQLIDRINGLDALGPEERSGILKAANLTRANLIDADLTAADCSNTLLDYACFKGTKINCKTKIDPKWKTVWQILNAQHEGSYQSGMVLQQANLSRAYLQGAFLKGANLQSANLEEADLTGANLQQAKLIGASLKRANLHKAKLERANLTGANLEKANTNTADFKKANLTSAIFDIEQIRSAYLTDVKSLKRSKIIQSRRRKAFQRSQR